MPAESTVPVPQASAGRQLAATLKAHPPGEAAALLESIAPAQACEALIELNPSFTQDILAALPEEKRKTIVSAAPAEIAAQWERNGSYEEHTVGRVMEPAYAVLRQEMTVDEAIEMLRGVVKTAFVTYAYVTDAAGKLEGLVTMRDLLFASHTARVADIMLRDVFAFRPKMPMADAMRASMSRHYPVYPVCDKKQRLLGLVRGQAIFEAEAFEITAQAGSMVGVEKEERISTPMIRSFRFRHPWLQINLLTAFLAASVVGLFEHTIAQFTALAVLMPVVAGQSGNSGAQALAVTMRGLALREIGVNAWSRVLRKEVAAGLMNGLGIALVTSLAVYVWSKSPGLALVIGLAMIASMTIAGIAGAFIPIMMSRFGQDPATSSTIVLTTVTDVSGFFSFLGIATLLSFLL